MEVMKVECLSLKMLSNAVDHTYTMWFTRGQLKSVWRRTFVDNGKTFEGAGFSVGDGNGNYYTNATVEMVVRMFGGVMVFMGRDECCAKKSCKKKPCKKKVAPKKVAPKKVARKVVKKTVKAKPCGTRITKTVSKPVKGAKRPTQAKKAVKGAAPKRDGNGRFTKKS